MGAVFPTIAIGFGLVLPALLLAWLLKTRARSRSYFASIVLLTAIVLAALTWSMLGFWYAIGAFWPGIWLAAFLAIVAFRVWWGLPRAWRPRRWEIPLTGLNLVHAGLWCLVLLGVAQARAYPIAAVDLAPPLSGGSFYVISGGANVWVNQHAGSRATPYAMDIAQLNGFGLLADGLFPSDLTKYSIFLAEVVAPCAGEVISVANTAPNQAPLRPAGQASRNGNHVAVFCRGHTVSLLHLQAGTVTVEVGDVVAVGQLLGRVGNSGNTIHPHLHIQAVAGRHGPEQREGARSVPIRIGGRLLVKGDSFRN